MAPSNCPSRTPPAHPVQVCDKYGVLLVMDASLLSDNLHFIKTREEACCDMSIREITRAMADLVPHPAWAACILVQCSCMPLPSYEQAGRPSNKHMPSKFFL